MTLAFLVMTLGNRGFWPAHRAARRERGVRPDDSGKDLGVFNIASALPQTAAPVVGAALLAVGRLQNQNHTLMLYVVGALALIAVLVVLPIKSVR